MENFITFLCNGKVSIVKNWQDLRSPLSIPEGSNYGIQCGFRSNITVVDCDVLKDKDNAEKYECGHRYFRKLIKSSGGLKTYVVKTPSGGRHYYFKYNPDIKTGINVISSNQNKKVKIDIRNDKSYVIGAGSEGYMVYRDYPIVDMPDWLVLELTKSKVTTSKEEVNKNNNIKLKDLETLVMSLEEDYYNDYDKWCKVLWAINTVAGSDGLDLADKFSQQSDKYNGRKDVKKVYRAGDGSIGLGSLKFWSNLYKLENNYVHIIKDLNKIIKEKKKYKRD